MLPEWIVSRLRCPVCQARIARIGTDSLECTSCSAKYSGSLPDLTADSPIPKLRMYDDQNYLEWRGMLAKAQDYFYQNPLVALVQNSGHRRIKSIINRIQPPFILDLGCGDGAHLPYVAEPTNYFGLDIDYPSLLKLKRRFPDAFVCRGDVLSLPIADASFPCIVNVYNLEHMAYLDVALEEMSRVLTDNGVILVSVPSVDGIAAKLARRISSARHFNRQDFDYDRVSELEHVNCIWQLDKAFRRHFKVIKRGMFPLWTPFLSLSLTVTYVMGTKK